MHGKVSPVYHTNSGVLAGLPKCLDITVWAADGKIMGVHHKQHAVEGVQFHPEALLTEHGHDMLANFLKEHAGRHSQ